LTYIGTFGRYGAVGRIAALDVALCRTVQVIFLFVALTVVLLTVVLWVVLVLRRMSQPMRDVSERMEQVAADNSERWSAVNQHLSDTVSSVSALSGATDRSASQTSEHLARIASSSQTAATEAGKASDAALALRAVLGNTRTRGELGEKWLTDALSVVGFDFETQTILSDGSRPDVILHLPQGVRVVLDAKMPLDAFERAVRATDAEERSRHALAHATALKRHILDLSNRQYETLVFGSLPVVIMFVPAVSAIAEAVDASPDLPGYARSKNVVLVDPISLHGVLTFCQHLGRLWKLPEEWSEFGSDLVSLHESSESVVTSMASARKLLVTLATELNVAHAAAGRMKEDREGMAAILGAKATKMPAKFKV
jgi:DNA anti-recombination protein RmuC